jgi:poly-beta-hydroxybutyrate-responsive repressor
MRGVGWRRGEQHHGEVDAPASGAAAGRTALGGRFIEPFLLLLLAEGTSHGYELMERVPQRGFVGGEVDAGYLYRTLRAMEEGGLVSSEWANVGPGPIRRVYALTARGEQTLHGWASAIRERADALQRFLDAYATRFPDACAPR